jgi:UDP-N-acetylglucosamine--N-acetylmuramyl-(pentapeptide) pyrophosphoryl-undecaprenol N-acetylglucosamine transferase
VHQPTLFDPTPYERPRTAPDGGRTLLVASSGGHLKQLHQLRPRLRGLGDEVTWVTFDTPQSRSLLAGERVVFARYTAPRDLAGVLANTRLARRLLAGGEVADVVSTGSAIALSFLPLARAAGASCHYIESATRVLGPSATGRLLGRVPGINLYNQHSAWAAGAWRYAGSVFDGFRAVDAPAPFPPRRVVVTLGTMETYGFRRLLERLVAILPPEAEVLWQTGCTRTEGLGIDARRAVGARELEQAMREADLVVSHAGTGSALAALEAGRCPVLVPRSSALGEHVDDHQVQVADDLAARGLALRAAPEELSMRLLMAAAARRVERSEHPPAIRLTAGRPRPARRAAAVATRG